MVSKQSIWSKLAQIVAYQEPPPVRRFILDETPEEKAAAEGAPPSRPGQAKRRRTKKKPLPATAVREKRGREKGSEETEKAGKLPDEAIAANLDTNLAIIRNIFHIPRNKDAVIREFSFAREPEIRAAAVFIEGISDKQIINEHILEPLMRLASRDGGGPSRTDLAAKVLSRYLPSNQVKKINRFADAAAEIIAGSTVLFFDGAREAISAETKGFEHRTVTDPKTEQVTQGPHLAFNEVLKVNTGLVRAFLRSPDLVTEFPELPNTAHGDVAVMYMRNIANPRLIAEVKRRLNSISTDYLFDVGRLEQYLEDHPYSPLPQILRTERPDRTAGSLLEGRVAILITGSPFALIAPITVFSLFQAAEDMYLRWPAASFLRIIRLAAAFLSLLLPALYVSIATFHQEMVPTDLMLAIAGAREKVPIPTFVEVMLMEVSFELVREAGIRVPGVIGATIGIVGTLILGQAAVAANVVSPLLIIIVAVTGLSSFALPDISTSFAFRLYRFGYILLAAGFGFFGVAVGLFLQMCQAAGLYSFGVPMLAPVGPRLAKSSDLILRGFVWQQDRRPDELQTRDSWRQPRRSRGWTEKFRPAGRPGGQGGGDDAD
ncbi:MAG: spore germination protein [bacterium]|jgi:spore germination protein KA